MPCHTPSNLSATSGEEHSTSSRSYRISRLLGKKGDLFPKISLTFLTGIKQYFYRCIRGCQYEINMERIWRKTSYSHHGSRKSLSNKEKQVIVFTHIL
jgi:hypothetical protein